MTASGALEALASYRGEISERVIDFYTGQLTAHTAMKGDIGQVMDDVLAEFATGPSKHIRGALAMHSYYMFGGTDHEAALQLAVIHALHNDRLLMLDDKMDDSDTRRGRPTVHKLLEQRLDPDEHRHIGDYVTIMADILGAKTLQLVTRLPCDPELKDNILEHYAANEIPTGYGQARDLHSSPRRLPPETEVHKTLGLKTAYYSFSFPLQTGAALAGADSGTRSELGRVGWHAGLAFQLRDDYLGMFGNPAETGKSTTDDLREGKITTFIHYILTRKDVAPKDKKLVETVLGAAHITEDRLQLIQKIMQRSGALRYVESTMYQEAETALHILDEHREWDPEGVRFLRGLIRHLIERTS